MFKKINNFLGGFRQHSADLPSPYDYVPPTEAELAEQAKQAHQEHTAQQKNEPQPQEPSLEQLIEHYHDAETPEIDEPLTYDLGTSPHDLYQNDIRQQLNDELNDVYHQGDTAEEHLHKHTDKYGRREDTPGDAGTSMTASPSAPSAFGAARGWMQDKHVEREIEELENFANNHEGSAEK